MREKKTFCLLFLQSPVLQSAKISCHKNVHEDIKVKINSREKSWLSDNSS